MTIWESFVFASLPRDLMEAMHNWADREKKDIKFTNKPFKKEIDSIGPQYLQAIEEKVYQQARQFIEAFRAKGLASLVVERLTI